MEVEFAGSSDSSCRTDEEGLWLANPWNERRPLGSTSRLVGLTPVFASSTPLDECSTSHSGLGRMVAAIPAQARLTSLLRCSPSTVDVVTTAGSPPASPAPVSGTPADRVLRPGGGSPASHWRTAAAIVDVGMGPREVFESTSHSLGRLAFSEQPPRRFRRRRLRRWIPSVNVVQVSVSPLPDRQAF